MRSSHTPPEQCPSTSATRSGPKAPPATSHSVVESGPTHIAYAQMPSGEGGSSTSPSEPGASTEPSRSSPVAGPVG